eukprot:jgi/Mesen1/6313/ME000325S05454
MWCACVCVCVCVCCFSGAPSATEKQGGGRGEPADDIFAFGCIVAELYLQRPLLDAASAAQLAVRCRGQNGDSWQPPPLFKELPAAVQPIVEACLQLDPARRPRASTLLASSFFPAHVARAYSFLAGVHALHDAPSQLMRVAQLACKGSFQKMGPKAAELCAPTVMRLVAHAKLSSESASTLGQGEPSCPSPRGSVTPHAHDSNDVTSAAAGMRQQQRHGQVQEPLPGGIAGGKSDATCGRHTVRGMPAGSSSNSSSRKEEQGRALTAGFEYQASTDNRGQPSGSRESQEGGKVREEVSEGEEGITTGSEQKQEPKREPMGEEHGAGAVVGALMQGLTRDAFCRLVLPLLLSVLQPPFIAAVRRAAGPSTYVTCVHPLLLASLRATGDNQDVGAAAAEALVASCSELGAPITLHQTVQPLLGLLGHENAAPHAVRALVGVGKQPALITLHTTLRCLPSFVLLIKTPTHTRWRTRACLASICLACSSGTCLFVWVHRCCWLLPRVLLRADAGALRGNRERSIRGQKI